MLSRFMQTYLVCCRCVSDLHVLFRYLLFNVYAKAKQTLLLVCYTGATQSLYKCSHYVSGDKSIRAP